MTEPAPDPASAQAVALRYAALGLRVLPIKPGTKRPPMREWVEASTADPQIILNWYTGMYARHGVGLAMGRQPDGRFIFAVDVDEHDPNASGGDSLAELERTHGKLPDTWRSITGSGGLHLLFAAPRGAEVRNGTIGPGLDIRGEGGQIVVHPTLHPTTGRIYEWEHGCAPWECDLADAPDWLISLLFFTPPPTPPATPMGSAVAPTTTLQFIDPDSPAEWLRERWDWPLQLRDAGWSEHSTARNGDVHWTRPGKDVREGESAVLHPGGPFVVFSTDASLDGLRQVARHMNRDGSVSVTPFEFYAWHRHGGNLSAAGRALHRLMNPLAGTGQLLDVYQVGSSSDEDITAGLFIDWQAFWRGERGDDWIAEPLIPAKRLTAVYAPAKQGKSEVVLAVVASLATGKPILGQKNPNGPRDVVYLDYEMTEDDLRERLELLGFDDSVDLSHLHYASLPSLPPLDTPEGAARLRRIATAVNAEVVVIDTLGRAVVGEENDNDTYRDFARYTGYALKAEGIACVRTDHAGKDKERGQRGASAKNDDADVVFRVDRVEGGWKLSRTHSRVGWVPESVLIDREERADGTLRIELATGGQSVGYLPGTGQYVADLKRAGITVTHATSRRQLLDAIKAVDPTLTRKTRVLSDALRWMKAELPAFTGGPTPVGHGSGAQIAGDESTETPAPQTQTDPDRPGEGNVEDVSDSQLSADEPEPPEPPYRGLL